MAYIPGNRVISGTHGQVWVNGELWMEITAGQAKYSYNKEEVAMCGSMMVDSKVNNMKGTGSISVLKVYSRNKTRSDSLAQGKDERATIIMALADPDAYGAERVALYDVSFDDDTLMDFQAGSAAKATYPFTFGRHEPLDLISV